MIANKKRNEKPVSVSEEDNDRAREDKMATKRKMKGTVAPMLTNIWAADKEVQWLQSGQAVPLSGPIPSFHCFPLKRLLSVHNMQNKDEYHFFNRVDLRLE